jgi:hypothetical protein
VRRCQQHDVGARTDQRFDVDPLRCDGDAHHLEAGGGGNGADLRVGRSSTAIRRMPRLASTWLSRVMAWVNPLQMNTFSGSADVPRARLR